MLNNLAHLLLSWSLVLVFASCGLAHFGVVLPSDDIVNQGESRSLELQLKFIHPHESHYMEMVKPRQFGVLSGEKRVDLMTTLKNQVGRSGDQKQDFSFWKGDYKISRPGDYTFYLEPAPYWEPAEDKFIVHYTKVCVNAFGLESSWDEPVGLETEIIPLTRPYGLWRGNLFSGQVLLKGKPLPYAEIEIEYLNEKAEQGRLHAPSDSFVTQVVKADARGVFHYAMPKSGWWGFAALSEADWKLQYDGVDKAVEIGAVFWVYATELQ
jgi:cobalt/nickel transport protein